MRPAKADVENGDEPIAPANPLEAVVDLPERRITHAALHPGSELGLETLRELRRNRRVRLIAILGAPDAGKTAALVSLYLLAASGTLKGFQFRNSETLLAFELLARGAREWDADGQMRDHLTARTTLEDPRRPGFLHLRLKGRTAGQSVDVAFPDLPGEWSDSLIDRSDHERLSFVRNADAIWIVVDGAKFASSQDGPGLAARTQLLLSRIKTRFNPRSGTPVLLVLTRKDHAADLPAARLERIKNEAAKQELAIEVVQVASFAFPPSTVAPGEGLAELLTHSLKADERFQAADSIVPRTSDREMLNYRSVPVT